MKELFIRFVVGGTVVAFFAVLGDLLKPKSFAGLLGAAPSVALATLSLTVLNDGKAYAQAEARSMIVGAIAFFIYALCVSRLLVSTSCRPLPLQLRRSSHGWLPPSGFRTQS